MSQQESVEDVRVEGNVAPAFPLALLESVRSHDRPDEVLEAEDLTVSMSRRLGMTGIIGTQIHRYTEAQRAGRSVRVDEVMGLIRLVLRRPDAAPILHETGQRVARFADASTAKLDPTGVSCALITGLLEELLLLYTGKNRTVTHTDCTTRGGRRCVWQTLT
jgi:hypothetical protein